MRTPVTHEMRRKLKEYHAFHGDAGIHIVKAEKDEHGTTVVLVRLEGEGSEV